jgi:hypothetical protein
MGTELLRFIIFTICAWTLSFSNFLNLFLTYLCIKISLRTNNFTSNYFDPIIMFSNLLNLFIHLLTFQINYLINNINKTYFGSTFFSIYNLANQKFVYAQNYIFNKLLFGPVKYCIMNYIGLSIDLSKAREAIPFNIPQNNSNIVIPKKLSNENEINDFLDSLINNKND